MAGVAGKGGVEDEKGNGWNEMWMERARTGWVPG